MKARRRVPLVERTAWLVWGMAVAPQAQTSTSQETKAFTVLAVNGNQLIVRLPQARGN
jgi:hypothetical protein